MPRRGNWRRSFGISTPSVEDPSMSLGSSIPGREGRRRSAEASIPKQRDLAVWLGNTTGRLATRVPCLAISVLERNLEQSYALPATLPPVLALPHPTLFGAAPYVATLLVALIVAAIFGKKGWDDPRYPGVDWELTRHKLHLYAVSCVKSSGLDAEEAVQYALEKAFLPTARPWDPAKKTILSYLGEYVNTKISNMRTASFHKRVQRGKQLEDVADTHGAHGTDPVSMLRDDGDEHNAERIFRALKEALASHPLPLFLIAIYEEGGTETPEESTTRALAKGYSEADIAAARQKIHREIVKLMDQEALEDAYGAKPVAR
jgi:hypothetical protein